MTKTEILDLKYGTPIQAGPFKGLLWRVEFVVDAALGEIWRVWFIDQYPVRTVETNIKDIAVIDEDVTRLCRQVGWEDCC